MGWKPKVFFQVGEACSFSNSHDDRRVQVHDDRAAARAGRVVPGQRPGPLPCGRPRGPDRPQRPRAVRREHADQPGHHRVRRHGSRELRLLTQHRDVRQAVTAQRDRRGQVRDDLPRVVHRPRRPPPGQPLRRAPGQAGDPHRLPQQDGPGLGHQAAAVRRHRHAGSACAILHSESAFGLEANGTLDKPYSSRSKALFHARDQSVTTPDESPRLACPALAGPSCRRHKSDLDLDRTRTHDLGFELFSDLDLHLARDLDRAYDFARNPCPRPRKPPTGRSVGEKDARGPAAGAAPGGADGSPDGGDGGQAAADARAGPVRRSELWKLAAAGAGRWGQLVHAARYWRGPG